MEKYIEACQKEIYKTMEKLSHKKICENFGQKEVRKIEDKYLSLVIPYSEEWRKIKVLIEAFDNWCSTYNGEKEW